MVSASPINPVRCRAVILVGVLWVVLILGLLLLGLNRQAQTMSARAQGQLEAVKAHWLARAGVERALAVLADDASSYDSQRDIWYSSSFNFKDIELSDGYGFRVAAPPDETSPPSTPRFGLDDEASRINLNRADRKLLSQMDQLGSAMVNPLIDWVDNNEESEPGGAERGYYQRLKNPYEIRNGPMLSGREPLLVKGMTPKTFFAEDVDNDGVLDRNENDGNANWPNDNADGKLDRGAQGITTIYSYELNKNLAGKDRIHLKNTNPAVLMSEFNLTQSLADKVVERGRQINSVFDLVDLRGEGEVQEDQTGEITIEWVAQQYEKLTLQDEDRLPGRININTASRSVLESIPGLNASAVSAIIERRINTGSYTRLGDLVTAGVLTNEQFRESADYMTVRSNVITVRSTGYTPSGTRRSIVAVIDRGGDTATILNWWQSE